MKRALFRLVFLFSVTLGAGTVRAAENYLCQSMLVQLPANKAKAIVEAAGQSDPWMEVAKEMKSGQVQVLAAPSALTKTGMRVVSEGKMAKLEVELNAMEPGTCDVLVEFKSDLVISRSANTGNRLTIGRSVVLTGIGAPGNPAEGILLLFRVVVPEGKGS